MGCLETNIYKTMLQRIATVNGDVLHALKNTENSYMGFGEAYFSIIGPSKVKAWKKHTKMTMNLVVPIGTVVFVFYDEVKKNFREEIIGQQYYNRLTVNPGIWFGFKGIGSTESLVLNISNIVHKYDEAERVEIHEIEYDWNKE